MSGRAPLELVLALALALGCTPAAAFADDAPADSSAAGALGAHAEPSVDRFLGTLSDSTDRYFGLIAAPYDTTGLDSALAAGLAHPWRGPRTSTRFSYGPVYAFNRVDGTLWGASVGLANHGSGWAVKSDLGYAAGSNRWLGGGEASFRIRGDTHWRFLVRAGRRTEGMDRDYEQRLSASLRALIAGSDRQNYLRRDGVSLIAQAGGASWDAAIGYHDRLETPLVPTTRWDLAHRALATTTNLGAAMGRAHEISLDASLRWPWLPLVSQATFQVSDRGVGSDFDYRRLRLAAGGEIAVGGHVSLLPQIVYGRLTGDAVPQASFFLGGPRTLRSLPNAARGGTGLALARLDLIGADDLLSLTHIPHPAMLAFQAGLFAASGATWGADPYGGPAAAGSSWPARNAWLSEVGVSLLYRPGVPDVEAYLRFNYGRRIGLGGGEGRWSVDYTRALDLLRRY